MTLGLVGYCLLLVLQGQNVWGSVEKGSSVWRSVEVGSVWNSVEELGSV